MIFEIPVLKIGDLLLVSIQNELNDRVATALQERILTRIQQSQAKALLIDISSLVLVNSYIARMLTDTARMARLMNTEVSLVGMQPTVAITITEMGLGLPDIDTSNSLDQGLDSWVIGSRGSCPACRSTAKAATLDILGMAGMREIEIHNEDDIVLARSAAREIANELAFSLTDKTRIATAVSELARNTLDHGGGGQMQITPDSQNGKRGMRCIFVDEGPGISDIERAMGEGFSSANSLGQGLPGARRLCDEFHIKSAVGEGTRVEIVKWLA